MMMNNPTTGQRKAGTKQKVYMNSILSYFAATWVTKSLTSKLLLLNNKITNVRCTV